MVEDKELEEFREQVESLANQYGILACWDYDENNYLILQTYVELE